MCRPKQGIVWSQLALNFRRSAASCKRPLPIGPQGLQLLRETHAKAHHGSCSLKTVPVNGAGVCLLRLWAEAAANGHKHPGFQALPAQLPRPLDTASEGGVGNGNWAPWGYRVAAGRAVPRVEAGLR